jgi:predicted transcriptional regulator
VAAGVPRDARLGALIEALETEQLDGRLTTHEQALAWLSARMRAP